MQHQLCMHKLHEGKEFFPVFQLHGPVKSLVDQGIGSIYPVSMMAKPDHETPPQRRTHTFTSKGTQLPGINDTSRPKRIIGRIPGINRIERYKGKHWRNVQRHETAFSAAEVAEIMDDAPAEIVRTKAFAIKPMHDDEALEQMELLGHTFFVYRDHDHQVRVVYRRKDGRYGVIVTA